MATGFIYLITNTVNSKVYVGLTTMTVNRRWIAHKSVAKRSYHHSHSYLHHSMNKNGIANFTVETLEEVDIDSLSAAEKKWIEYYGSCDPAKGYNLTEGGNRPVHTAESRRKLSEAKKGTVSSQATRDAISKFHKGRKRSPETVERLRLAAQNRPPRGPASEETKAKMRATQSARRAAEAVDGIVRTPLSGADHPNFGKSPTQEAVGKMKVAKASVESRAEISERTKTWWANNPELVAEARKSMSESGKNRKPISEETRAKLAESSKAQWARRKALKEVQAV